MNDTPEKQLRKLDNQITWRRQQIELLERERQAQQAQAIQRVNFRMDAKRARFEREIENFEAQARALRDALWKA